jgi:uncharacterized coiled-coil protein SlyX
MATYEERLDSLEVRVAALESAHEDVASSLGKVEGILSKAALAIVGLTASMADLVGRVRRMEIAYAEEFDSEVAHTPQSVQDRVLHPTTSKPSEVGAPK